MSQSRPSIARIEELAEKKAQLDARIEALNARRRLSQKKDEYRLKWLLDTLFFDSLRPTLRCRNWCGVTCQSVSPSGIGTGGSGSSLSQSPEDRS